MNISRPNKTSEIYRQFLGEINKKVSEAVVWLNAHEIEYVWNYWAADHLYRLYIPHKDLLLDFEYYPVNNIEYNYIRVNFDTNIIQLMEQIFPSVLMDTKDLDVWKLTQRACNHFLRENGVSPIYDKNVIRLAWVQDKTIYQCIVVKDNKIIANVRKQNCSVTLGTYMMLRYLNEMFGFSNILIKENLENSYPHIWYRLCNIPAINKTHKKKIWWSPSGTKWKIKKEQYNQYVPFYFCEDIIYMYGK